MNKDDIILAFFPCIRFEAQIILWYKGTSSQIKDNWNDEQKLENDIKLHTELHEFYCLITQLVILCLRKGLRLVIENPYTTQHYLTRYWALEPKVVDTNRRKRGDYQVKPTQYWFVNCEPERNFIFEPIQLVEYRTHSGAKARDGKSAQTMRSMIHPQYANRFIREHILDDDNNE